MTDRVYPYYDNAVTQCHASLESADGSLAECTLYDMLRSQLPPEWSFMWGTQLGSHEYDFLVLVPGEGIVNIECKGHGYRHLPNHKFEWRNKATGLLETKDIIGQAAGARRYYIRYLQRSLFGEGYQWGLMSFCVVFPLDEYEGLNLDGLPIYRKSDCDVGKRGLKQIVIEALDRAREQLVDRYKISDPVRLSLVDAERIYRFWMCEESRECHDCNLVRIDLRDFKSQMNGLLTVSQSEIMRSIRDSEIRQHFVEGAAGTGKTVLATAATAELTGRTLYVCFNKVLARNISLSMPDNPDVMVSHFHKLDEALFGRRFVVEKKEGEDASVYWQRVDAEMLREARALPPGGYSKFDNIIVDEAQDLTEAQLRFLLNFRKATGRLIFFADMEQMLYPDRLDRTTYEAYFPRMVRHVLEVNLRNTIKVDQYCKDLMPTDVAVARTKAVLPGPLVEKRSLAKDAICDFIRKEVLSQFNPSDIAVLSPVKELLGVVNSGCGITFCGPDEMSLAKTTKNLKSWHEDKVGWKSSTSSFKGLEAMVVVHLVPRGYAFENLLYVGGSRASYKLFVIDVV